MARLQVNLLAEDTQDGAAALAGGEPLASVVGVWPEAALANHSCAPNAVAVLLPGGSLAASSRRDLAACEAALQPLQSAVERLTEAIAQLGDEVDLSGGRDGATAVATVNRLAAAELRQEGIDPDELTAEAAAAVGNGNGNGGGAAAGAAATSPMGLLSAAARRAEEEAAKWGRSLWFKAVGGGPGAAQRQRVLCFLL
eukprot:XP_001701137.1 predicted protein [Chlamydomonas reinhardtii]